MSVKKTDLLISELAALKQKAKDLVVERKQLQDRLKAIDEEIYALNSRHGKIERLEKEVAIAIQVEADTTLPLPVWVAKPRYFQADEKTFVISRITSKRIYIREQGKESETFYDKESGRASYALDGELNVLDTIKLWEEYQKCNT